MSYEKQKPPLKQKTLYVPSYLSLPSATAFSSSTAAFPCWSGPDLRLKDAARSARRRRKSGGRRGAGESLDERFAKKRERERGKKQRDFFVWCKAGENPDPYHHEEEGEAEVAEEEG